MEPNWSFIRLTLTAAHQDRPAICCKEDNSALLWSMGVWPNGMLWAREHTCLRKIENIAAMRQGVTDSPGVI